MPNINYLIEIENLRKSYHQDEILKGINLNVRQGELISIIGRSGCGKTTLLRCMNGLEILNHGRITIDGITLEIKDSSRVQNIEAKLSKRRSPSMYFDVIAKLGSKYRRKISELRSQVGMLFQSFNLFPHLTVLENVSSALKIVKKLNPVEANKIAIEMLDKVGLKKYSHRMPGKLSGGQAQRVAIARALAMSPKVMLYDEPTSALDPELVEEVLSVMRNLHKEGMTQIVVTHAMDFAQNASDRVIFMDDGQIIEDAPSKELFSNPKDDRTRKYLQLFNE